jgi:hypothetical protein
VDHDLTSLLKPAPIFSGSCSIRGLPAPHIFAPYRPNGIRIVHRKAGFRFPDSSRASLNSSSLDCEVRALRRQHPGRLQFFPIDRLLLVSSTPASPRLDEVLHDFNQDHHTTWSADDMQFFLSHFHGEVGQWRKNSLDFLNLSGILNRHSPGLPSAADSSDRDS